MTSFSIVTIVYNDVTHIKETMESVISQSHKNIEYILVDGGSNDGTKEVIIELISSCATITLQEQQENKIYLEATHNAYPTLIFKFSSERDKGIYDAMNKGIALASREWINFMNCGDRFYDLEVLQKVANENIEQYDVVYGDTEVAYTDQNLSVIKTAPKNIETSLKRFGANVIHQSMFFKTSIHKQHPYDIQDYKIANDYELIYRLFDNHLSFCKISLVISVFHTGGASDMYAHTRTKESLKIAIFYQKSYLLPILIFCFAEIKKIAKIYFPKTICRGILKFISK